MGDLLAHNMISGDVKVEVVGGAYDGGRDLDRDYVTGPALALRT